MAEFCKKCFKRMNPEVQDDEIVMSESWDMCEGCVIVTGKQIGRAHV